MNFGTTSFILHVKYVRVSYQIYVQSTCAVMFQGDPLQYSTYREEAIDALVGALERNLHSKKVQEQCNRALMLLSGRFSRIGEATSEKWLLKRAGASISPSGSFRSKGIGIAEDTRSVCVIAIRNLFA